MITHFAHPVGSFWHRIGATVVLTIVIVVAAAGCSAESDQLASVVSTPSASGTAPGPVTVIGVPTAAPEPGAFTPAFPGQPSPTADGAVGGLPAIPSDECPASGLVLVIAGQDAATGLRVVSLRAYNCSRATVTFGGHPGIRLLDEDGAALPAKVLNGVIELGIGNPKPVRLALKPGQSADATLSWRNITLIGPDPVTAAYVRVVPAKGFASQILAETVDIGTTGKLAVTAWHRTRSAPVP